MNKKAQFVAILSLLFVLGLIGISAYLVEGTGTVIKMYNVPVLILNQDSEIEEYLLNLNQHVKYSSFKAFRDLCGKGGFYGKECESWRGECPLMMNIKENFKKYFIDYFLYADEFDINITINITINENYKFVVSGEYKKDEKIFEIPGYVKTEVPVEFNYVLDYDVSMFEKLFSACGDVIDCEDMKKCIFPKTRCSSNKDYINFEYKYELNNGFIHPKIEFKLRKSEELEV